MTLRSLLPAACVLLWPGLAAAQPAAKIDFNRDVRPILSNKCFACHGPDSAARKAKLRLDTKLGAFAPLRDGSFAIVPGKYTLHQTFVIATTHYKNLRLTKDLSCEFAPDPAREP